MPSTKARVVQKVMILYVTLSGTAKTSDSFPDMLLSQNNNYSSNKYLSVNISVPFLQPFVIAIYSALNANKHPTCMDCLNILLGTPSL